MNRREFIVLVGASASTITIAAPAQQPDKMRRIGMLIGFPENDLEAQAQIRVVREGLERLGWREGGNVGIDYRWSGGDSERARVYAAELVGLKPDVIVVSGPGSGCGVPKRDNLNPRRVRKYRRSRRGGLRQQPGAAGRKYDGADKLNYESSMTTKWVELLKQVAPLLKRVALLFNPRTHAGGNPYFLRALEAAAPSLSVEAMIFLL